MNILDIIIAIVIAVFAVAGLRRGLILEAFALAAFIIGIYGAMYFCDFVSATLTKTFDISDEYVSIVAFILTFILLMLLVRWLGKLVYNLVNALYLGFLDKIGGLIFGAAKGAFIVSILILILNSFGANGIIKKEARDKSVLYVKTEAIATFLYQNHDLVKHTMDKGFDKSVVFIDKAIDEGEKIIDEIIDTGGKIIKNK